MNENGTKVPLFSMFSKNRVVFKSEDACFQADGITRFGDLNLLVLPYQGKDIVFRFIIEYNSLRDFGP
jgi:hypothetical protein